MVQHAVEGKKDVKSVNAGQGCSNTGLRIVDNSNKWIVLEKLRSVFRTYKWG